MRRTGICATYSDQCSAISRFGEDAESQPKLRLSRKQPCRDRRGTHLERTKLPQDLPANPTRRDHPIDVAVAHAAPLISAVTRKGRLKERHGLTKSPPKRRISAFLLRRL